MAVMESTEPSQSRPAFVVVGGGARVFDETRLGRADANGSGVVSFDRRELNVIFNLYGAKVAAGEWRDYALDFTPARAVFSIFRRASEAPLYRIEKNPDLARRQGAYSVIASTGHVMRRGQELARVLRVLDRRLKLVPAE